MKTFTLSNLMATAMVVLTLVACSKTTIHHPVTVFSQFENIKLLADVSDFELKSEEMEDNRIPTTIMDYPAHVSYEAASGFINKAAGMYVYKMTVEAEIDIPVDLFAFYFQEKIEKEVEGGEVYPTKIGDSYFFTKGVEDIEIKSVSDNQVVITFSLNKLGFISTSP
ncbi:MAG: hypothetical protein MI866_15160 [Bacteroidales bacterium]|nr:hypothetical protein [Bacteroidales bacterium]